MSYFELKSIFSKSNLINPPAKKYLRARFTAVLSLLMVITASSLIAPAQNNQSKTVISANNSSFHQPVIFAGIWNYFSFLGFGSDDGKIAPPTRPQVSDAYVGNESESSDSLKGTEPVTTDLASPCTSMGGIINVPNGGSIQAAINAANPSGGDTIQVAAGTFQEQLVVNKCVTITGAGQGMTIIQSPNTLVDSNVPNAGTAQSIIEIRSNSYVTMSNLTVTGPVAFTSADGYGIFVVENSVLNLSDAAVTDIRENPLAGNQRGLAIAAGRNAFNQIGSLILDNVTVTGYQKGGIIVDRTGSTATINRITVMGAGPIPTTAQNGIQISRGATGIITNSTINGNSYTGTQNATAAGITLFNAGAASISNNTLTGNEAGIFNSVNPIPATLPAFTVNGNTLNNNTNATNRGYGVILQGASGDITNNFINDSDYAVLAYAANNSVVNVTSNSITNSSQVGIYIANSSGTTTTAQLTANFNRIANNIFGAYNATSSNFNAENNFWGCNEGPNDAAEKCDAADGVIDFNPFLQLTRTTASQSPVNTGGTSTVTTNLRYNSDNVDTFTTLPGNPHLPNPIPAAPPSANSPNGIPVNFLATNGTVDPTVTPLVDGLAFTTFTGGTIDDGDQTAIITAQVDNATDTANVTVLDATAPTVVSANVTSSNANTVTYTVVFSEAVNGVDTTDFTVTTAGNVVASVTNVSGTGSTRAVTVTVSSGMGTIRLDVLDNNSIVDTASAMNPLNGGANNPTFNGQTFNVDVQMPTVTINQAATQPDPTNTSPINFTVVFNEPVTGFATGDVTLSGTAVATTAIVSGSGTTYNVAVSGMTSSGTVIATIGAGVAFDADNNGNAASTSTDNTVNYFTGAVTFYVDDDGMASAASCDDPDPVPNTIQAAIDLASAGDTIRVCPGRYAEELNINKDLTLLGPNDMVNPNMGPTRNPNDPDTEAIIVPTTMGNPVDPTFAGPLVVFLGADGITFSGFTVDGNNPAMTSGVIFNGQDVDAEFGIYGTETANPNAVINNNIVQNIGEIAVWVTSNNAGGPKNANSSIFDNKVDNVLGAFGQAIRISDGAWVDVKTNIVTRSRIGITIENYYPGNTGTHPASEISDNNITAFRIGIRHNLHYNYVAPGFTIRHNTVNPYVQAVRPSQVTAIESPVDRYQGIRLESIQNGVAVNVFDNILTGNRAAMTAAGYTENSGLYVTNSSTNSANMLLTGNSVTDFIRGANNETPAVPTFNCNNFFGNTTGVYLSSAAANGLTAANNNIIGNGFGMQNDGPANVNAQSNYWGAANGPGPVGPGNGDNVSTNVDFSNFLTAQATCAMVVPEIFPTVTINQAMAQADPTNASPINFTVVFSEPVTGFDGSDVILSGTAGATTAIVTQSVPNDAMTYNVAVSGMANDGTVIAMIRVGAAQSVATGSSTSASTSTDNTVIYDRTPPTATVSPTTGQPDPTNSTVSFTIVFSEPTTNFTQGDVTVTNGTITSFSGSGMTYTVVVTPTATGAVTATVAAGVATDAAENPNIASNTATVNFDGTNPSVMINQAAGQADPTSTSPINFTVVFSEPVTGFSTGDVTVSGTAFGAGSNPSAVITQIAPNDGTTYNVAVSGMNQTGTVIATIAAGVAVDNVGNPNTASTSTDNTVTFNLADTIVTVNPTNTNTAGPTMWFGFDDVTDTVIQPSYVTGPTGQPLGAGSSRIRTSDAGKYLFANNTTYAGTRFDQITELSYSEYANNPGNAAKAPSLQIGVDFNLNDADESFQGRLVFEPYQNTTAPNQPLVQGTWQRWNATNGLFYTSRGTINGNPTPCSQDLPCTRAQLLAAFPNVGIHRGGLGLIGFRGEGSSPGIGFEGNVDAFTVGVNSSNRTFDFEPTPPTISIGDATVAEGNSGTTTANFTITQSVVSQLDTTVTFNTMDGTATAGSDYQAVTDGTATIAAGSLTTMVSVTINGDMVFEPTETFTVKLSDAVNAAIADGEGLGTITNDEAQPTVSISNTMAGTEPNTPNTFTVTLSGQSSSAVTVDYATANGTATAGSDYTATNGTITFPANTTTLTQAFNVPTLDDTAVEGTENFTAALSNASGATIIGTNPATGTIADNDSTIQFASAAYPSSDNTANTVTVTVTRTGVLTNPATVDYTTVNGGNSATGGGSCTAGVDYINTSGTLNFTAGVSSQTFNVSVCQDANIEGNETVNLTLSNPQPSTSVTLGTPSTAVLTISDGAGGGLSISGIVTPASGVTGVNPNTTVTLTGTGMGTVTTMTDANGNYSFNGLQSGRNYLVTPSKTGFAFEPINRSYANLSVSVTNANFTAYASGNIPRKLIIGNVTTAPGNAVNVPVNLRSLGNENGISFTLDYDETKVTPTNVACGSGAPAGCAASLTYNIATVNGNMVLTVSLDLPNNVFFTSSPPDREALVISFSTTDTSSTTPSFVSALTFTDNPTPRAITDGQNPLPAEYVNGSIIFRNIEADVAPRQTGDGAVAADDVSQMRRFVAFLDTPNSTTNNEFQRADCAPLGNGGDGRIDATDLSQARRYAAGFDPLQPASGPTMPASPRSSDSFEKNAFGDMSGNAVAANTTIRIVNTTTSTNSTILVTVAVDAAGNENAFGFSVMYDPTKLSLPSTDPDDDVLLGSGAVDSTNTPATLTANTLNSGKVGILLDFRANRSIVAGTNRQLAQIRFKVASGVMPNEQIPLVFTSDPIIQKTANVQAQAVSTDYTDGTVSILGPTASSAEVSGRVKNVFGNNVSGAAISLTDMRGRMRSAITDDSGFYQIAGIESGGTYIINVEAKNYTFSPRTVTINENLTDFDLILQSMRLLPNTRLPGIRKL